MSEELREQIRVECFGETRKATDRIYEQVVAPLAARLAEVEAERDEAVKLAYERIEKQNVETGKRVDLIHEREAFRAERDRLAQELEDALGHLRAVLAHSYPIDESRSFPQERAAREFLARFPEKEDGA